MDETPDRPPVPDGDPDPPTTARPPVGADHDPAAPHGLDSPSGTSDPGGPGGDGEGDERGPGIGDLPPLGDIEDPPARRALTPLRIMAAVGAVAVVAAVAFVGMSDGSGEDDATDGVASIDGTESADGEGDDDPSGGGGGGRIDDSDFQDAMLEYAACMREHGIDMPDPQFGADGEGGVMIGGPGPDGGGQGPAQEDFEAADEACQPIMDEVRPDIQLTPEEQAEMQDQQVAVAQCMRDKGWDMPDPQVNEDGSVMIERRPGDSTGGKAPTPDNREEHETDMEACNEELGIDRRGPARASGGGES
jgi:hypothetical protein